MKETPEQTPFKVGEDKPRIRIYKSRYGYDFIDITKKLKAFYDPSICLQKMWCLAFGKLIK